MQQQTRKALGRSAITTVQPGVVQGRPWWSRGEEQFQFSSYPNSHLAMAVAIGLCWCHAWRMMVGRDVGQKPLYNAWGCDFGQILGKTNTVDGWSSGSIFVDHFDQDIPVIPVMPASYIPLVEVYVLDELFITSYTNWIHLAHRRFQSWQRPGDRRSFTWDDMINIDHRTIEYNWPFNIYHKMIITIMDDLWRDVDDFWLPEGFQVPSPPQAMGHLQGLPCGRPGTQLVLQSLEPLGYDGLRILSA